MSGVFVQMIFSNVEQQSCSVGNVSDITFIENFKALEEIKRYEQEGDLRAMPGMQKKMTMAAAKLPTLMGGGGGDSGAENKRLKAQIDDLKAKIEFQEKQLIQTL